MSMVLLKKLRIGLRVTSHGTKVDASLEKVPLANSDSILCSHGVKSFSVLLYFVVVMLFLCFSLSLDPRFLIQEASVVELMKVTLLCNA